MKAKHIAASLAGLVLCSTLLPAAAADVQMSTVSMIGDADKNGKVSVTDAVKLSRFLLTADDSISANADLNGDGMIDVFDLVYLKKMLLGTYTPEDYTKLVINEVCASNKKCYTSADGSEPDWIEIYNSSGTDIHLDGYGISDGTKKLFKYTFPEGTVIKAGGHLIVLCDGDGKVTAQKGEHLAPFNISAQKSETLYLTHPYNGTLDAFTIPAGIQTDVTYGRSEDGGSACAMLSPTPGTSNQNAEEQAYVADPVFSAAGGFYGSAFDLEITAEEGLVYYTLDGSDPRTSPTAKPYKSSISIYDNTSEPNVWSAYENITLYDYYENPAYPVDKGIVVRAAAKDADGNFSRVISNSYFVGKSAPYYNDLKVISITTDGDNLFDNDRGIYVIGSQYYEWLNGPDGYFMEEGNSANPTNYNAHGKEWEVPASIQLFENGEAVYSANVGMRINGNWSRAQAQKSLRLYARAEYGTNKLSHTFIDGLTDVDGKKINTFNRLLLHNNGNDFGILNMRDVLIQALCDDRAADRSGGYEPCVAFINGEFWGFYNIRERVDEYFFEAHYHVDKDNVTYIKNGETTGQQEIADSFEELCQWAADADMTDAANYQRVCDTIDVESLMDMIAVKTYVNDDDFAPDYLNNYMLWRTNDPEDGNAYGDGRWRFMLNDIEMCANLYGAEESAPEYDLLNNMYHDRFVSYNFIPMFYNLLHNDDFRQEFAARYKDIMENNFAPSHVIAAADAYAARCRNAILDTNERFNMFWYDYDWEMASFKDFFNRRPKYAELYLNRLLEQYGDNSPELPPVEPTEPGENMFNSEKSIGLSFWDDGEAEITVHSPTSFTAVTLATGEECYNPQTVYKGLTLEWGKTYRLTFTVSADEERQIDTCIQKNEDDYTSYLWTPLTATTTPTTHSFEFTMMDETCTNVKWSTSIGYETGTYVFTDVSLVCLDQS